VGVRAGRPGGLPPGLVNTNAVRAWAASNGIRALEPWPGAPEVINKYEAAGNLRLPPRQRRSTHATASVTFCGSGECFAERRGDRRILSANLFHQVAVHVE
jgi:hypothetical protein